LYFVLLMLCMSLALASCAAAQNKAPNWYQKGACVYRISTPDAADVLPQVEQGVAMVSDLLDGTVRQIPFVAGIVGHDHPGPWNWDGAWPYWNRVTFRASHSWEDLAEFMRRVRDQHNVYISFHVNLTDVNIGLKDYPETRAFFEKLAEAKAIYRRDRDPQTKKRDVEPPYVPTEIPEGDDPVAIFALVNYKNFWDSGLAKEMIDNFYAKLPYAPPLLYLDVLTLGGGNFNTGYPDGPLGGSRETQAEGRMAIVQYLRSLGTEVATEGTGTMRDIGATYGWYHGTGYSNDDYSQISGGYRQPVVEQTFGSAGAFNVSPIGSTPHGLTRVREHYAALLAGKSSSKQMPGLETAHVCMRPGNDEFDIPGTGDSFRGDWADLVNNFYLINIQELYHVGKGNVRTKRLSSSGIAHLRQFTLINADGTEYTIEIPAFTSIEWKRASAIAARDIMLEEPIVTHIDVPEAGPYQLVLEYFSPSAAAANIYANDRLVNTVDPLPATNRQWVKLPLGMVDLQAGRNTITIDSGPIRAEWSDGTRAVWSTPALGRGFKVWRDDVVFAEDYDRMWPDTWSGQKKIYFYSWYGTSRTWKLPEDWSDVSRALLYSLTPDGRGTPIQLTITGRRTAADLLPQVPYVMVPATDK